MRREIQISDLRVDYSTAEIASGLFVEVPTTPVLQAVRFEPRTTQYVPMVTNLPVTAGRAILGCPPTPPFLEG